MDNEIVTKAFLLAGILTYFDCKKVPHKEISDIFNINIECVENLLSPGHSNDETKKIHCDLLKKSIDDFKEIYKKLPPEAAIRTAIECARCGIELP